MANRDAIQAILEQARLLSGASREGFIFRGATIGGTAIGRSISRFAERRRVEEEKAQTEHDIDKMNTLSAQGQDGETILRAATTPAAQAHGVNMIRARIEEARQTEARKAGTRADRELDLRERSLDIQEERLEAEDTQEVTVRLPGELAESVGADPNADYSLEDTMDLFRINLMAKQLREGTSEEEMEEQIPAALTEFLNGLITSNDLDLPEIREQAMMDRSSRSAMVNLINNALQEKRRVQSAADLSKYRGNVLDLRRSAQDLRKREVNLAMSQAVDEAARTEIKSIMEELDRRTTAEEQLDFSQSLMDQLNKHADLKDRYEKAIGAGVSAREEIIEGRPQTTPKPAERKVEEKSDDYYRKLLNK